MRNSNKLICGVGYKGDGKYLCNSKSYKIWTNILRRCYSKEQQEFNAPTYVDCSVYFVWLNYQRFAEWYEQNYVEGWHLDKDILVKGNKIYGPDTCCFVPKEINTLFVLQKSKRGNTSIGVSQAGNRFRAMLGKYNSIIDLGYFDTEELAFQAYKFEKEKYIKEVANIWKDKISEKLYNVMINYIVTKND